MDGLKAQKLCLPAWLLMRTRDTVKSMHGTETGNVPGAGPESREIDCLLLLLFVRDEVRPVDAPAPSPSPARQHSSHRSWLCLASFAFTLTLFGARVLACSGTLCVPRCLCSIVDLKSLWPVIFIPSGHIPSTFHHRLAVFIPVTRVPFAIISSLLLIFT